jgi:hypothetical protein
MFGKKEAANCGGLLKMAADYGSPPMAIMPPTIVVATAST